MFLRLATALLFLLGTASALAHSGHGAAQDWHWHATDASGFLMVALLGALTLWASRGGD